MTRFNTKTGQARVEDGHLILDRTGWRGRLSQAIFGDSMARARIVYAIPGLIALVLAGAAAARGAYVETAILLAMAALFGYIILRSRGLSMARRIALTSITHIQAHPPIPGATRAFFVATLQVNGKSLKRYIMMPGVLEKGQGEYARARQVLEAAGLKVSTAAD